jgi:hypothetical protein
MTKISRTNITIQKSVFSCFALAIVISVLQGCNSSQPSAQTAKVVSSPEAAIQNDGDQIRCSTIAPTLDQRLAIERNLKSRRASAPVERAPGSVSIRVFFHIIKNTSGEGGVSEAALRNQINVLNEAFAGRGPGGVGAPTPFTFELAGFEETVNDAWFNMRYEVQPQQAEIQAKATLNKGGRSALNIYTVRLPFQPFGWARFPWEPENVQGVVIGFNTLPGGSEPFFNQGDTATHEVGHWLGLFHTFENGCNAPGDQVDDTPPESGATRMCPPAPDSCPGDGKRDSIRNFMNLTNDQCMFQFTTDQARRMDMIHQEFRR